MSLLRIENVLREITVEWAYGDPLTITIPIRIGAVLEGVDLTPIIPTSNAPVAITSPTISPLTPAPGETITVTPGTYTNSPMVSGQLTLDGSPVALAMPGLTYQIPNGTADGAVLLYTETAQNGTAPNAVQTVSTTVDAEVSSNASFMFNDETVFFNDETVTFGEAA